MRILILLTAIVINGCVTAPVSQTPAPAPKKVVSIGAIKEKLRLVRNIQDLGYDERPFNACELGLKGEECADEFLTIIHFQLVCRETEGTVSEAPTQLIPVQSDAISWKLGEAMGVTQTDSQGFGKVEARRLVSSASSRLRLTIEDRFVATPARETTRIVVPKDWCPR
jgi:hypothetical protein